MSVFGFLAGNMISPSLDLEQQKSQALRKMTALSDEITQMELALANKRMQLESAKAHAKAIGALKPQTRRTSRDSITQDDPTAGQGNGRRRSTSHSRNFCYNIKQICLHTSTCDIIIEQGPCIIKTALSHFTREQDKQTVAKLVDDVKAKGKDWGGIGVLLSKFNRAHAVQSCGGDKYTLVPLFAK